MGPEPLPGDLEPELVQTAEGGQVRASEGSVRHVEVFQMGGVRTSIIGRPRPLPRARRANPPYTLDCEELEMSVASHIIAGPGPSSPLWNATPVKSPG